MILNLWFTSVYIFICKELAYYRSNVLLTKINGDKAMNDTIRYQMPDGDDQSGGGQTGGGDGKGGTGGGN